MGTDTEEMSLVSAVCDVRRKIVDEYGSGLYDLVGGENTFWLQALVFDDPTNPTGLKPQAAILDVAQLRAFSSDRTIAECAADIWKVEPCPVSS